MMITQTDLEHAYSAKTVQDWADDDRDGTADAAVIAAAVADAASEIEATLEPAFPEVFPLTPGNEPKVLQGVAVIFAAYILAGRRQKRPETITDSREKAEKTLEHLLNKGSILRFPDGATATSVGIEQDDTLPSAGVNSVNSSTLHTTPVFTDAGLKGFI